METPETLGNPRLITNKRKKSDSLVAVYFEKIYNSHAELQKAYESVADINNIRIGQVTLYFRNKISLFLDTQSTN